MAQLTIEIPDPLAGYLETQVSSGHSPSVSEFVQRVLRTHRAREAIEEKVLAADMANESAEVTPAFFESLRAVVSKASPSH